ncbi:MAG: SCO family protein [Bacteroidetes bacterium]|nr:SCO family protein [Bacteroidota bacterium]
MNLRSRTIALIVSSIALFAIASCKQATEELPYYNTPDFTPSWARETHINIDTLHRIAHFAFFDQTGATITDKTYGGKLCVANFFFTTCSGICPKMTNNLSGVAKTFANNNDVMFASFSVTPQIDSVAQLASYAATHKIDYRRWHLLTGDKKAIYDLARLSYFAEAEPGVSKDSSEFLHTEHLILVDREGHIRGVYDGTLSLETERLIADIRTLLKQ